MTTKSDSTASGPKSSNTTSGQARSERSREGSTSDFYMDLVSGAGSDKSSKSRRKTPAAPPRPPSPAERTHEAATALIEEEREARAAKSARLRKARLERDGSAPASLSASDSSN